AFPPTEHGRFAALCRADGLSAADPAARKIAEGSATRSFRRALHPHAPIRSAPVDLSGGLLVVQSLRMAAAIRLRCLVRTRRRQAIVADPRLAADLLGGHRLSVRGLLRDADVVFSAAGRPDPGLAGAPDLSDQQD